jgi:hypothetical protein
MEYDSKGEQHTVLLIEGTTPEKAALNLEKYRSYMEEADEFRETISGLGEQAFTGDGGFYGAVVFARKNRFIIGVLGLEDVKAARNIIETMFRKL